MLGVRCVLLVALAAAGGCRDGGTGAGPGSVPMSGPVARPIVGVAPMQAVVGPFSFLVGGHLYGDPRSFETLPSPWFVDAVDRLAAGNDRFFVSLGDLVRDCVPGTLEPTLSVLRRLRRPVYNTPGNHDWSPPGAWVRRFGESYGAFSVGGALCILLNTELVPWNIEGEQRAFLERALAHACEDAEVHQVFVFAHKLLFVPGRERYRVVWEHGNSCDSWSGRCGFESRVRPLLVALARAKPVIWFGGDVGAPWSRALFLDRDPETGVTFVAVGLGGQARDALVRVTVPEHGPPSLEVVPLGEEDPGSLSGHGLEAWQGEFEGAGG